MEFRHRFATISAPILLLGVAFIVVFLAGLGADAISPGSMSKKGIGGLEALFTVGVIFILLFFGLYFGFFLWLLCMKPFFKREELIPYISPNIPVVTNACFLLFNMVFPEK